jgi:hypothetical protein
MTRRRAVFFGVLAITVIALTASPRAQQGQRAERAAAPAAAAGSSYTPAKLPDGQPDMQGMFAFADRTPFETPGGPVRRRAGESVQTAGTSDKLEDEGLARLREKDKAEGRQVVEAPSPFYSDRGGAADRRKSQVVFPENGKVPLKEAAVKAQTERMDHFYDSYAYMNPTERCITRQPGPFFAGGPGSAAQIIQGPGYVAIVQELLHEARIIPLTDRPHLPASVKLWAGDSIAHWEGNSLIIDTTNFDPRGTTTSHAGAGYLQGHRNSEALHVVERFTIVDKDTINYEVTFDDPNIYTSKWTVQLPLRRDSEYKMYEYACHEGNYRYMTNTLRAGRVQDGTIKIDAHPTRVAAEESGK